MGDSTPSIDVHGAPPRGEDANGSVRAGRPSGRRLFVRFASLVLILELALAARIIAADAVQIFVDRRAARVTDLANRPICIFPDTRYYWDLARTIRQGTPYEILYYGDIPHFTLRTPGYPLFLTACQAVFGERALPVRLVQALLGTLSVWLVYRLTRSVVGPESEESRLTARGWTVPLVAALIAGLEPYTVLLSPLILSEALFVPLMLLSLWGMAVVWHDQAARSRLRTIAIALGIGASLASAVLVRPSWSLFVPILFGIWIVAGLLDSRRRVVPSVTDLRLDPLAQPRFGSELARRLRVTSLAAVGFVIVMSPWWTRNYGIYGRFVPTALWTGASLYDGLNPRATGASDMTFLSDPDIWPLGEEDQDELLTRRAITFAREQPGRTAWLAAAKFGRYWRPWPDADGFRSVALAALSATFTLPLFALMAVGAWASRHDLRVLVLLAGPILYFCVLHLAFASSMRYRIPGEVPALALASIGLGRVLKPARRGVA